MYLEIVSRDFQVFDGPAFKTPASVDQGYSLWVVSGQLFQVSINLEFFQSSVMYFIFHFVSRLIIKILHLHFYEEK